jgi:hypothetical protein
VYKLVTENKKLRFNVGINLRSLLDDRELHACGSRRIGVRKRARSTMQLPPCSFNTSPNLPPLPEVFAKLYELRVAEVRVVDAMLKLDGVVAIAEMLGVTESAT